MAPPLKPQMPPAEPSGFVPTLNHMGYMTSTLDPVSRAFTQYAGENPERTVLDIGAAYGVATLEALSKGAKVVANDIEPRHLEILGNRTPEALRSALTLLPGKFPEELTIAPESLDAILLCRVLHFFKGPDILSALRVCRQWLKGHGRIFIVTETPFLRNFASFLPLYEENKKKQLPWPGLVEDVERYAPARGKKLPPFIHFLDEDVLTRLMKDSGFTPLSCAYLPRKDFPPDLQLDGRESIGAIAENSP